jgi:hypothetical protein
VGDKITVKLAVRQVVEADVYRDIVRIPEVHRYDTLGKRVPDGTICLLRVRGTARERRIALRGCGKVTEAVVKMDEKTREDLGVTLNAEYDFEIEPQGWLGELRFVWTAHNPAYRVAGRLGVLSGVLGVLGVALGVLSLVLAVAGIAC